MATLFDKDESLAPLPQRVLLHLSRYKASFLEAVAAAVLSPAEVERRDKLQEVDDAISTLCDCGKLERLRGDSFFARRGVYLAGHTTKMTDIALVYYCFLGEERRWLVTYQELKPLFAAENLPCPFHNYRHVLTRRQGVPTLARVYHCKAANKNAREQIRRHITEHSKGFGHWVDDGSYQLSVLVASEGRKKEVEQLITETYRTSPPLGELAGITVSVVPTEETFEKMVGRHS
ncbi:hypothetical protein KOR34_23990 [Posidoniimonas corsicana]|uniref:Uncharacterized protein n=1 Tax=Posidoniimonas corsicana TaxID=1938618 RepID=A0A5C5VFK5_9BACT|nr:hypothetical protein [Posidoniimonas corsicana]TWT37448.1 hypothetical protein KOR34_23990 [Posidoniimonas corsicana]